MREEISAAVVFITRLARKGNVHIKEEKIQEFSDKLECLLSERFKNHWYQDTPQKGQGYRCIRMNETVARDPVIVKAAEDSGIKYSDLRMPPELTIWVDPREVCCRFGEAKGSWCTLFKEGEKEERVNTPVIEKVLSEFKTQSKPIEVTRINARPSSTSPPMNQRGGYYGNNSSMAMRNFNHNHNNNLNKFNNKPFNQNRFRGPPPPPPPPMMCNGSSTSPTFLKNKFGSSPPPKSSKFHHQFQQRISSGRNDRYHWVRGADLVKA